MSSKIRMKAKRSGYSARIFPGTLMDMEALKKSEIFCSTRLSKVELQARATLAVPERGGETYNERLESYIQGLFCHEAILLKDQALALPVKPLQLTSSSES